MQTWKWDDERYRPENQWQKVETIHKRRSLNYNPYATFRYWLKAKLEELEKSKVYNLYETVDHNNKKIITLGCAGLEHEEFSQIC